MTATDRTGQADPLIASIDQCREQRGWTIPQLAEAAGIQVSTCRHLLRGTGTTLHTLRAVAAALGLEVRLAPIPLQRWTPSEQAEHRRALAEAMRM